MCVSEFDPETGCFRSMCKGRLRCSRRQWAMLFRFQNGRFIGRAVAGRLTKKLGWMMNKRIIDALACPECKAALTRRASHQTASGAIKHCVLHCEVCAKDVAAVRHGKVDFLRLDPPTPPGGA